MPLFHGQRDVSLLNKFNMELINDIIDTEVAIYKLSIENTQTNLYNESDKKVYQSPIKIYNGDFWEVDSIQENQFFGGKNPDYAFSGEKWGQNISIVANTHLTRRSRIHIEEFRPPVVKDTNDLPSNI